MNDVKPSSKLGWRFAHLVWWAVILVVGIVIGIYQSDRLYQPGCKLTIHFYPPSLETNCPSPFETNILISA